VLSHGSLILGLTLNQLALPLLVGIAAVLLLRGSSRWIRGKAGISKEQARNRAVPIADQAEIRSQLEKLMVELEGLARRINAHIDTRFCKLEVLMKEADRRIERLERLTGEGEAKGTSEPQGSEPSSPEPTDPDREVIYKLADTGKGAVEIAQELNKHPGEVELILSLRRTGPGSRKVDYRID